MTSALRQELAAWELLRQGRSPVSLTRPHCLLRAMTKTAVERFQRRRQPNGGAVLSIQPMLKVGMCDTLHLPGLVSLKSRGVES
jgi:hypothetical protein